MKEYASDHTINKLDYWIKKSGYKKYEVAEATKIPLRTLNDYCRGRTSIPRFRLESLATFLECSISDLLDENITPFHATTGTLIPSLAITRNRESTLLTSASLSDFDLLVKSRRQVLQDMLSGACVTLTLSPYELLPKEKRAQLDLAKTHASYLDHEALEDLQVITTRYWSIAKNASIDILSGISGHFTNIVQFLKDPHPESIYRQLCALASENALILGKTFHDIKEYDLAWAYYKFALKVALDTGNMDLWAVGIGRVALLLIY
jgi:DNA-binding Xre family transcriptional regulator